MAEFQLLDQTVTLTNTLAGGPGAVSIAGIGPAVWVGYYLKPFVSPTILADPFRTVVFPPGPVTVHEKLTLLHSHDWVNESYQGVQGAYHGSSALSQPGDIAGNFRWDVTATGADGVVHTWTQNLALELGGTYDYSYSLNSVGILAAFAAIPTTLRSRSVSIAASWYGKPINFGTGSLSDIGADPNTGQPGGFVSATASGGSVVITAENRIGSTSATATVVATGFCYPGHAFTLSGDLVRTEAADLFNAIESLRMLVCVGTDSLQPTARLVVEEYLTPVRVFKSAPFTGWAVLATETRQRSLFPPAPTFRDLTITAGAPYTGPYPFPVQVRIPRSSMGVHGETFADLQAEFLTGCTTTQEEFVPAEGRVDVVDVPMNWPTSLDPTFASRAIPIRQVQLAKRFLVPGTWSTGTKSVYTTSAPRGFGDLNFYRYAELKVISDQAVTAVLHIQTSGAHGAQAKQYQVPLVAGENTVVLELTNPFAIEYVAGGSATLGAALPLVEGFEASTIRFNGISSVLVGTELRATGATVHVESLTGIVKSSAYLQQGGSAAQDPAGVQNYQIVVDGWVAEIFSEVGNGRFLSGQEYVGGVSQGFFTGAWDFILGTGLSATELNLAPLDLGESKTIGDNAGFFYDPTRFRASSNTSIEWVDTNGKRRQPIDLLVGGQIYGFPAQSGAGMAPGAHLILGKPTGLEWHAQYVYGYEVQATAFPARKNITGFQFQYTDNSSPSTMRDRGDGLYFHDSFRLPADILGKDVFHWVDASSKGNEPSGTSTAMGYPISYHLRVVRAKDAPFAAHFGIWGPKWGGWVWAGFIPKSEGGGASVACPRDHQKAYWIAWVGDTGIKVWRAWSPVEALERVGIVSPDPSAIEPRLTWNDTLKHVTCVFLIDQNSYRSASRDWGVSWDAPSLVKTNVMHHREIFSERRQERMFIWIDVTGLMQIDILDRRNKLLDTKHVSEIVWDDTSFDAIWTRSGEGDIVDVVGECSGLPRVVRSRDGGRSWGEITPAALST